MSPSELRAGQKRRFDVDAVPIAGATGTNGSALVQELSRRGMPVRALVRDLEMAKEKLPSGIELVRGDLSDPASLAVAFDGIEKAYVVTALQPDTVSLLEKFFS